MWKWLHPYAKAERAYQLCNTLLPYFTVIAVVGLVVGWVWGLAYAPADYQQKDSYRIIFIHVPSAIWSMGTYSSMAIAAVVALVWQIRNAELAVIAIAPVGAAMTAIALITGAAWGKRRSAPALPGDPSPSFIRSTNEGMNASMNEWTDRRLDKRTNELTNNSEQMTKQTF